MKIGIYGNGVVGKSTALLSQGIDDITTYCYDILPERCIPDTTSLKEIADSDIVFICLPTPIKFSGACHTDIVEEAVKLLRSENSQAHFVIRSTVIPGTCKGLGCHHMPNFVTAENGEQETSNLDNWIIGVNSDLPDDNNDAFKSVMEKLLNQAKLHNNITSDTTEYVSLETAEIVKYTRNAFFATKIGFFNEIKSYCDRVGVNYQDVSRLVTQDTRIGATHSQVPGPDGKAGFAGKGLMKDLMAFCISMESVGNSPLILRPVLGRNARRDRPNENWSSPIKTVPINKGALDRLTISQLRNICEQRKINTDNCVEKIELREKIIDQDTKLRQAQQERERLEKEGQKQTAQVQPPDLPQQPVPQGRQGHMYNQQMAQGRQGHMYNQQPSSFQEQLNAIRARQSQSQIPGQGHGQIPGQGQFPSQYPHQFGFGQYGTGFPPQTGGGPVQMNIPHPSPQQMAPLAQHPGPMSVQNGSRSLYPPQSNVNSGASSVGFNGGIQSSF
jgi:UDPglucose 6-dehydrogenase